MWSTSGLCSGFELTDQACPWHGHITRTCRWVEVIPNNTVKAVTWVSQERSTLKTRYDPSSTISFAQNSILAIYIARTKGKGFIICNFESVNNMSDSLFWVDGPIKEAHQPKTKRNHFGCTATTN